MAKKKQSQKDFNKGFYGEIPKWIKQLDKDDKPKMRKIKNMY